MNVVFFSSLGSNHDNGGSARAISNTCGGSEGYIMGAMAVFADDTNAAKLFYFSKCSIKNIENNLQKYSNYYRYVMDFIIDESV